MMAQIEESLLALSPAERLVLSEQFGIGDVAALSGQMTVAQRTADGGVDIGTLALRKLRNQSMIGLDLRDDRSIKPNSDRRRPVVIPMRPRVGGPVNVVPPPPPLPRLPEPDEDPSPDMWDEV